MKNHDESTAGRAGGWVRLSGARALGGQAYCAPYGKAVAQVKTFTAQEEAEIRTLYREAKRPVTQIGICAQLYACTKTDIRRVLRLSLVPDKPRRTVVQWTRGMEARLIELADGSYTMDEIADEMRVTSAAIKARTQRLRAHGYTLLFLRSRREGEP